MSRVDEALRRAAEQAAAAERTSGQGNLTGAAASVVDAFPEEMVSEAASEAAPAPPTASSAAREIEPVRPSEPSLAMERERAEARREPDDEPPDEEPHAGRGRRRSHGSIFERIDSRLTEKVV